jgi:phage tail sheath protein FI
MPAPPSYPGVPISESAGDARRITGVATSITAFVGSTSRGPVGRPTTVRSDADLARVFGGPSTTHPLGHLVRDFFRNGGSEAVVVRIAHAGAGTHATTASATLDSLTLVASSPGDWGNRLRATIEPGHDQAAVAAAAAHQGVALDELFDLTVVDAASGATEEFRDITVVEGPRRIDLVLATSQLVAAASLPGSRPAVTSSTPFHGGGDGDPVCGADYAGDEASRGGVWSLLGADPVNLVCLAPPHRAADVPPAAWQEASRYCVEHRAFLVVDAPLAATTAQDVATFTATTLGISGTDARDAAIYFPRLHYADPQHGNVVSDFPCSGAVAGTIARTDATRGVWTAPAGTGAIVSGAVGLAVAVTDDLLAELTPLGVNCLRSGRGGVPVVWGARTLRGTDAADDEYRYVPVRRLALFIEESIVRGTAWAAFEPNEEPLWAALRLSVGSFLQELFRLGAFQGATPRDAWFVHCDAGTMTPAELDAGICTLQIGVAPLRPAEFVVLRISLRTAAATVAR